MKLKWINLVVISLIILCMQLIACSSQPDYIGKWEKEDGVRLELTQDGHIIYDFLNFLDIFGLESPALGTYEPFGEEFIKVSFDGEFGNALQLSDTDTWKLTVTGNSMVVVWGDNELIQNYKRIR